MDKETALKILREHRDRMSSAERTALGTLIPELNESEDKRFIMEYLYDGLLKNDVQFQPQFEAAISWLEKQGGKPTDEEMKTILQTEYEKGRADAIAEFEHHVNKITPKEEPKFKVGDWVAGNTCWGSSPLKIVDVSDIEYRIEDTNGNSGVPKIEYLEEHYHLWTIQDAKKGDVLAWNDTKCITLFKNIYDKESYNSYGFVGHCTGQFGSGLSYHSIEGAHPATKEQRDLLFEKMKEAGYVWDADKKKLKNNRLKQTY